MTATPERNARELKVQLTMGFSLQSVLSWGAPEAGAAFNRARQLCARLGDDPHYFAALSGVAVYHLIRTMESSQRAPPSPPGAVFTKEGLAALPTRHSWAKEA